MVACFFFHHFFSSQVFFTFLLEKPNKIWDNGKFVGLFQLVPLIYFQKSKFNFKFYFNILVVLFSRRSFCWQAKRNMGPKSGTASRSFLERDDAFFYYWFYYSCCCNLDLLTSKAKYGTKKRTAGYSFFDRDEGTFIIGVVSIAVYRPSTINYQLVPSYCLSTTK